MQLLTSVISRHGRMSLNLNERRRSVKATKNYWTGTWHMQNDLIAVSGTLLMQGTRPDIVEVPANTAERRSKVVALHSSRQTDQGASSLRISVST